MEALNYYKNYPKFGMNEESDAYILPIQYKTVAKKPLFEAGKYSIDKLEQICREFEEYCHQQAIIKQNLIEAIKNS